MSGILVQCEDCGGWSAEDDWDYQEEWDEDGDPPLYEYWWTCPRCGAETPDYPE